MALRYVIPGMARSINVGSELVVPPAMRPAVEISFRRESNIKVVARDIMQHTAVKLIAAVGTGKSTRVPPELALVGSKLVFHITPNPLLARDQFHYAQKCAVDNPSAYPALGLYTDAMDEFPRIGVVYIGAPEFVALMIKNRTLQRFGQCIVFLDEAHESDAYTHVIRNLAMPLGAGHLVLSSATFKASDFRMRETPARVTHKFYPGDEVPETWRVTDRNKPWSASMIRNNILIFTDSRSLSTRLMTDYRLCGFKAYRLEANMDVDLFDEAMAALRDRKGPMVALLADYTFRSGFTFPVSTIMDTGRVSFMDATPGQIAKRSRSIYKFEAEQTAGRGGRVAGIDVVYYRPEVELQGLLCSLEGVDMEAAALLYRALGFYPNAEIANTFMAHHDLTRDVDPAMALNGHYPLSYYFVQTDGSYRPDVIKAQLVDRDETVVSVKVARPKLLTAPAVEKVEIDKRSSCGSQDSAIDMTFKKVDVETVRSPSVTDLPEYRSRASSVSAETRRTSLSSDEDFSSWARFAKDLHCSDAEQMAVGKYYYSPVLERERIPEYSMSFPRGLDSVVNVFQDNEGKRHLRAMPWLERIYAMDVALERYNVLNVDIAAMRQVISQQFVESGVKVRDPLLKQALAKALERMSILDTERRGLLDGMQRLSDRALPLIEFEGLPKLMKERVSFFHEMFESLSDVIVDHDHSAYAERMERSAQLPRYKLSIRQKSIDHYRDDTSSVTSERSSYMTTNLHLPSWMGNLTYTSVDDGGGTGRVVRAKYKPPSMVRRLSGIVTKDYREDGSIRTRYVDGRVKRISA